MRLDRRLLSLIAALIGIPFLLYFFEALFHFDLVSLTGVFFQLLFRSIAFGLGQALLSAAGSSIVATVIAAAILSLRSPLRKHTESFLRSIGQLLFVIPGTSIALLVLSGNNSWIAVPRGWALIIAAHILWSAFFVAGQIVDRSSNWLDFEGADLLRAARSLGASKAAAIRRIALPFLVQELKVWFPLIFLWSFGAFSTVLLLGAGPEHSTPEVLLYYTLLNDLDTSRLLILFLVSLALQFSFLVFFYRRGDSLSSARFAPPDSEALKPKRRQHLDIPAAPVFQGFALLSLTLVIVLVLRYVWAILGGGAPHPDLWQGLLLSWTYATITCALLFVFLLWGAASSSSTRRPIFYLLAVTPVLLATSWSHVSGILDSSISLPIALVICGFGLALLQLPFAYLWIDRSLSTLDPDLTLYARSAGLSERQIFWRLQAPFLRPIFEKILTYTFCIALGEIALASIWLREHSLLSLVTRRLAQSYDFQAAAWVFVLTIASALVARYIFSKALRRILP